MDLYLDTADVAVWQDLMPTGLFKGITTNPLLAKRAGLVYSEIDWLEMAQSAAALGAQELHIQVYGPSSGYVAQAKRIFETGQSVGIETVVKVPLTEDGIRTVPQIKSLGGKILMTAAYSGKQMLVAGALDVDYIAAYFGRIAEAGLPEFETMYQMRQAAKGGRTRIMVASLRNTTQIEDLTAVGHDCFTLAPDVARDLMNDSMTIAAVEAFEAAAQK